MDTKRSRRDEQQHARLAIAVCLAIGIAELGCGTTGDEVPGDGVSLLKQVSIDGGATFLEADDGSTAPITGRGGNAEYRLLVTNRGASDLEDVVVSDPSLGIDAFPVGNLGVGQTVILSKAGISALAQPGVCKAAGDVINIATVDAVQVDTGTIVMDSDPAVVRCEDGNLPPEIVTTPATGVVAWQPYSYDVDATDPENDPLSFNLDTAPAGMTIDTASGLIEWTPTSDQLGARPVAVRVTDDGGLFDTQSFTVDVASNPNLLIYSTPPTTAAEGVLYSYDVEASDPEDDPLTFNLDIAPAGMTIDTASGLIQWTPAGSQTGTNSVTVRVTDDGGASDTQSFSIDVTPNQAPTIISTPATNGGEGVLYSYDVEASDPEDDPLTFSLDIAPAGMTIDTASGLIQWTPAGSQTGTNSVTVRVTDDGGASDTQSFSIDVTE